MATALSGTGQPGADPELDFTGVSYIYCFFRVRNEEILPFGRAWSPPPDPPLKTTYIVSIVQKLIYKQNHTLNALLHVICAFQS